MPLKKTQAVALKKQLSGETSLIVRLYTEKFGKVSIIAKGARNLKSKFSGILEPINLISVIFYYKEGKSLFILSQADLIETYPNIRESIEKTALAFAVMENILQVSIDEEENPDLFALINSTVKYIEISQKNYQNYYWLFLFKLAELSGTDLSISHCLDCGKQGMDNPVYFSAVQGGIICSNCRDESLDILSVSPETFKVLKLFDRNEAEQLSRILLSKKADFQLRNILERHLTEHVVGFKPAKSLRVFSSITGKLKDV